jgi:hypothetical protein
MLSLAPGKHAEFGLRVLVTFVLLLALVFVFGRDLLARIMPLFRWEMDWLGGDYRVLDLGLTRDGADSVIRIEVVLRRALVVGTRVLAPDPRGVSYVTALSGNVLQPPVLFAGVLASWPAATWRAYPLRILIGMPMLVVMLMIDVPLVLLAALWSGLVGAARVPESFSPLLAWSDFLQGGGRYVLALAAAAAAVAIVERVDHRPRLATTD